MSSSGDINLVAFVSVGLMVGTGALLAYLGWRFGLFTSERRDQ